MSKNLKIVIAQLNFLLGDIHGNTQKIIASALQARDQLKGDIIVFPELALTAYPPEDLLLRPELHRRIHDALQTIQAQVSDITLIIGHPDKTEEGIFNAASIIRDSQIIDTYHKQHLPNYSVFDEKRYFAPGDKACVFTLHKLPIAVTICEDLWQPGPLQQALAQNAKLMICLNASPFHHNKPAEREAILSQRQQSEGKLPIVYTNLVGGQDELIFDGTSFVLDSNGKIIYQAPSYQETLGVIAVTPSGQPLAGDVTPLPKEEAGFYDALVLGTRDYVEKNGFDGVLIGLSGGIDSALTTAIATDALGKDRVHTVLMPSRFTAPLSIHAAQQQAKTLGTQYSLISIEESFEAILASLASEFAGLPQDTTEENIQARCRGIILMALSNKTGKLVLTTGNKSEMAVGYATLYGDMAGGFAVLKDVSKTLVYRLANYRNSLSPAIPQEVIDRPPSAELAANQTDQDTLPPYKILDQIMVRYVEYDQSIETITTAGFNKHIVEQVVSLIDKNEYKRRQAPPGIRISARAFGRDWRYPITSGYYSKE